MTNAVGGMNTVVAMELVSVLIEILVRLGRFQSYMPACKYTENISFTSSSFSWI